MPNFQIKESFFLQSVNKLVQPGQYFQSDDEAVLAELRKFEADGSCKELVPQTPAAPAPEVAPAAAPDAPAAPAGDPTVAPAPAPEEDISVVPGLGKKAKDKLEAAGIKTLTDLKTAMLDPSKHDELEGYLGKNFDKVKTFLLT